MLITELIRKALRQVNEPPTGDRVVSKQDCLDFINEARRRLQEFVDIVRGDSRIIAISGEYEYAFPLDYKTNMYRVEYNGEVLIPVNMDFLDEYDSGWRLSTTRSPPDAAPKYCVKNAPERILYVYPPPVLDGDSVTLTNEDAGLIEEITLAGDTVSLGASETGTIEELKIAGETFSLGADETGTIEELIPQVSNIRVLYDKFFVDIEIEDFAKSSHQLDLELEPFQDAILDYVVYKISELPQKVNVNLASTRFNSFTATISKLSLDKIKNIAPLRISAKRAQNLSVGRRRYG